MKKILRSLSILLAVSLVFSFAAYFAFAAETGKTYYFYAVDEAGNFAEASLIHQEQEEMVKKLERIKKRFQKAQEHKELLVGEEDVAVVVSAWTKIPVQKLYLVF